jgi:hypothetical protein
MGNDSRTPRDVAPADSTSTDIIPSPEELQGIELAYGSIVEIDSSDFVVTPVRAADHQRKSKRSSGMYFGWDSGDYQGGQMFNMVFYQMAKDSSHLLFPKERAIILNYRIPQNEKPPVLQEAGTPPPDKVGWHARQFIFYRLRNRDYNLDGRLNYKDSDYLYVSKKDGSGLTQLTPNNSQLRRWEILKGSNILLAEVLVDSNDDKIFDVEQDDIRLLRIDLRKLKKGQSILPKGDERTLKSQFYDLFVKE